MPNGLDYLDRAIARAAGTSRQPRQTKPGGGAGAALHLKLGLARVPPPGANFSNAAGFPRAPSRAHRVVGGQPPNLVGHGTSPASQYTQGTTPNFPLPYPAASVWEADLRGPGPYSPGHLGPDDTL